MKKSGHRLPKGYNGTSRTARRFAEIIPTVLSSIQEKHNERHDLVLAAWPQIVGRKIAMFSRAESFAEGVLKVRVNNSTLFSLLVQSEKSKLLCLLREKFPKVKIQDIVFRMG